MFQRTVRAGWLSTMLAVLAVSSCSPDIVEKPESAEETEVLSRTEFTDRIENFFEYDPLRAGESSQFLIHLSVLEDGTPVAEAQVELSVRSSTGVEVVGTTAQVGRVTGIYVADLAVPSPGTYSIDFRVRNDRLNEQMSLAGFDVE